MEFNRTKVGARSGDINIITVEEFERRKDRFRRATKEYYEQAEREFRCLQGFCGRGDSSHNEQRSWGKKRIAEKGSVALAVVAPGKSSLKRCRRRRSSHTTEVLHHKPELEMELAKNLLESHFKIVESSIEEYLVSIKSLVRPVRWWRHDQPRQRDGSSGSHDYPMGRMAGNGEGIFLQVPLPLPFDKNQEYGECMQSRLHRHHAEAVEEKHMAMASVMLAVRETKLTEELAKNIHNGVDAIQIALRKISALIEANSDSTFYYYRYNDCHHRPGSGAAASNSIDQPESAVANQQEKGSTASWNRTVVEARKLDGYYRWFCANNGVLLIGKNSINRNSSSRIESRNSFDECETDDDANRQGKRLRKESIDSIMLSING